MNEKQELLEYLSIIEMKLLALHRDIRNIRGRLQDCELTRRAEQRDLNFFTALRSEDDDVVADSERPTK